MQPTIRQHPTDALSFIIDFDLPADFITNGDQVRAIINRYPAPLTKVEGVAMEAECQALFDATACAMIRDKEVGAWLAATGLTYTLDGSTVWGGRYLTLSFSDPPSAALFKLAWG